MNVDLQITYMQCGHVATNKVTTSDQSAIHNSRRINRLDFCPDYIVRNHAEAQSQRYWRQLWQWEIQDRNDEEYALRLQEVTKGGTGFAAGPVANPAGETYRRSMVQSHESRLHDYIEGSVGGR